MLAYVKCRVDGEVQESVRLSEVLRAGAVEADVYRPRHGRRPPLAAIGGAPVAAPPLRTHLGLQVAALALSLDEAAVHLALDLLLLLLLSLVLRLLAAL